jgi:hypothetical protein
MVHSGERARDPGVFRCPVCRYTVLVEVGERMPSCPCGGNAYDRDRAASAVDGEVWQASADR